jgi:hypothetical protein
MKAFRIVLVSMFVSIVGYTAIVGVHNGWNLFPIFFNDIAAMTWPGQFNFDFSFFLIFSALWLSWRHHFSPGGLVLGAIGIVGGSMFLSIYLLYLSFKTNGNIKEILLGKKRANS